MADFISFLLSPLYLGALAAGMIVFGVVTYAFGKRESGDEEEKDADEVTVKSIDLSNKAFSEKREQIKRQGKSISAKLRRDGVTVGRVVKARRVDVPMSSTDYEDLAGKKKEKGDSDTAEIYQFLTIKDNLISRAAYKLFGFGSIARRMESVYLVNSEYLVDPDHSIHFIVKSKAELSKKVGNVYTTGDLATNVNVRNVYAIEREQATVEAAKEFVKNITVFGFDAAKEAIVEESRIKAKADAYQENAEDKV